MNKTRTATGDEYDDGDDDARVDEQTWSVGRHGDKREDYSDEHSFNEEYSENSKTSPILNAEPSEKMTSKHQSHGDGTSSRAVASTHRLLKKNHEEYDEDAYDTQIMEEKSIVAEAALPEEERPSEEQPKEPKEEESEEEGDEDDEDEEEDDGVSRHDEGLYDPNEFVNLPVGSDVKELFQFITSFTPQVIELDTVLKPFILDYIPAVGDVDAFIKVPRPDDVEDNLGLAVLDEPCAKQSDPTVLDLHLRANAKDAVPKHTVAKQVTRADKNPKEIENWIKSISELHKSKPATSVHYSRPMPDIETLMQEWPPEVEELLKQQIDLPTADFNIPLEQYVDVTCSLLDIPVYKSRVQSLHVLFTLYSEFKNSQHFRAMVKEQNEPEHPSAPAEPADRLVLH